MYICMYVYIPVYRYKVKGKVHPRTGREGPERERERVEV
jgi:hypothetical protein